MFPQSRQVFILGTLGRQSGRESSQGQLNVAWGFLTKASYQIGVEERRRQPEPPSIRASTALPRRPSLPTLRSPHSLATRWHHNLTLACVEAPVQTDSAEALLF